MNRCFRTVVKQDNLKRYGMISRRSPNGLSEFVVLDQWLRCTAVTRDNAFCTTRMGHKPLTVPLSFRLSLPYNRKEHSILCAFRKNETLTLYCHLPYVPYIHSCLTFFLSLTSLPALLLPMYVLLPCVVSLQAHREKLQLITKSLEEEVTCLRKESASKMGACMDTVSE